jgi:protocatechuate 3,4-dioxygenase, beta subunit
MKAHWLTYWLLLLVGGTVFAIVPPRAWDVDQAPSKIPADSRIAGANEPGVPLLISGTVYGDDGVTPLSGIVVYAYHTDINGVYRADHRVDAPPRLRGWARTDAAGHYSFRTIRPAPYPKRDIPAHVHFHVWGPGVPRQFVDDLRFRDDPLIKSEQLEKSSRRGIFATVCTPKFDAEGVQRCTFNIRVRTQSNSR